MAPDISLNTTDNPRRIIVLSIALLVIGGGLVAYGVTEYQTQSEVLADVDEVQATIIETDIQYHDATGQTTGVSDQTSDHMDDDTQYRLHVVFEYEYDGQQYESSKFDAVGSFPTYDDHQDATDALADYNVGDQVTAYVPPDDPGEAFLEEEMPFVIYALIGFGAFLVLGAIWIPIAHHFGIGRD